MNLKYTPGAAATGGLFNMTPTGANPSTERLVFYRCDVGWASAGLNFNADAQGGVPNTVAEHGIQVNHLVIVRNFIHDLSDPDVFGSTADVDAHAVGVQNGDGHIVRKNVTDNTGPAIVFFCVRSSVSTAHMRNHTIAQNSIRNTHDSGGKVTNSVGGIEITDQSGVADCTNNIVKYNSVHDLFATGDKSNTAYKLGSKGLANIVLFEDNVADTIRLGFFENTTFRYTKCRGLTVKNPTRAHVSTVIMEVDRIDFDLNTYIDGGTPPTDEFVHSTGKTFAQWQAIGALHDPNSSHS